MDNFCKGALSSAKDWLNRIWNNAKTEGDDFLKFSKANPILGILFLFGAKYAVSKVWNFLKELRNTIRSNSLCSLKKKYQGRWAFVADVSKEFGATCATLLAENGYDIIALNHPNFQVSGLIKSLGKVLEVVEVSAFCAHFDMEDTKKIKEALEGKVLGVIVMNLYYDSPCHFDTETPIEIMGSINACVIKTFLFLNVLMYHIDDQPGKVALMTTGSIVGGAGWPGLQMRSACANFIESVTENIKTKNVDMIHLKSGYVPPMLKDSFYFVEKRFEAENGLRKIGVCQKEFTQYRIKVQNMFHNSKYGKENRFAYARLGLLSRYSYC